MSSSVPCNIPYVLKLVAKNIFFDADISQIDFRRISEGKPVPLPEFSILDVGCGFGKWGFLIRDTFEVMLGQNFRKQDWRISITGVEPFDRCITGIQKDLYHKIIQKDIFEAFSELEKYDLVILGDVIEHFEKRKAFELLNKLFKHSDNIIVSTPLGFIPQGAWADNHREIHKSGWDLEDFEKFNIVEYKILQDKLFLDILRQIPNISEEMKNGIKLIVLWISK